MINPNTCTMDNFYKAEAEDRGGWCAGCANWCNPKSDGAGDWGKVSNNPWDYKTLFYCGKCATNDNRKHKKLHR